MLFYLSKYSELFLLGFSSQIPGLATVWTVELNEWVNLYRDKQRGPAAESLRTKATEAWQLKKCVSCKDKSP